MPIWSRSGRRAGVVVCFLQIALVPDAQAKIDCEGSYQVVSGTTVRTPYCEAEYLAAIARSFGLEVSGARIRDSHTFKKQVCQVVDSDSRAESLCVGTGSEPLF